MNGYITTVSSLRTRKPSPLSYLIIPAVNRHDPCQIFKIPVMLDVLRYFIPIRDCGGKGAGGVDWCTVKYAMLDFC